MVAETWFFQHDFFGDDTRHDAVSELPVISD